MTCIVSLSFLRILIKMMTTLVLTALRCAVSVLYILLQGSVQALCDTDMCRVQTPGYRACLDQHLIAIRSPVICGDHLRSRTSLIAITSTGQLLGSGLSRLLYKLGLTRHLATSCTVLHATRGLAERTAVAASLHQQPVVHCEGGRSRSV